MYLNNLKNKEARNLIHPDKENTKNPIKIFQRHLEKINLKSEEKQIIKELSNRTYDTKIRWFKYRLSSGTLTTNKYLSQTPQEKQCTFCRQEEETIIHIFLECRNVTPIIELMKSKIKTSWDVEIGVKDLLSINSSSDQKLKVNLLIAKIQRIIYQYKCAKETLPLGLEKTIEMEISLLNNTLF